MREMGMDMRERLARAIADHVGDGFDNAHVGKPDWIATRGEKGGRFRDVNEPRQSEYLAAADAVLVAMMEPSGEMIEAGRLNVSPETTAGSLAKREPVIRLKSVDETKAEAGRIWQAMLNAAAK